MLFINITWALRSGCIDLNTHLILGWIYWAQDLRDASVNANDFLRSDENIKAIMAANGAELIDKLLRIRVYTGNKRRTYVHTVC